MAVVGIEIQPDKTFVGILQQGGWKIYSIPCDTPLKRNSLGDIAQYQALVSRLSAVKKLVQQKLNAPSVECVLAFSGFCNPMMINVLRRAGQEAGVSVKRVYSRMVAAGFWLGQQFNDRYAVAETEKGGCLVTSFDSDDGIIEVMSHASLPADLQKKEWREQCQRFYYIDECSPYLTELAQKAAVCTLQPLKETTVIQGVLAMVEVLSGKRKGVLLLDAMPGVLLAETEGQQHKLLPQDEWLSTTLPVKHTVAIQTNAIQQPIVDIRFLHQTPDGRELCLGRIDFDRREALGEAAELELTVDIDLNGAITVSVSGKNSGVRKQWNYSIDNIFAGKDKLTADAPPGTKFLTTEEKAAEKYVLKFLPVYDNLERALQNPCPDEAFQKGVEQTMKQFRKILSSLNAVVLDPVGSMFDPQMHHAISSTDNTLYGKNVVVSCYEKGVMMNGHMLRYAKVEVTN